MGRGARSIAVDVATLRRRVARLGEVQFQLRVTGAQPSFEEEDSEEGERERFHWRKNHGRENGVVPE